MTRFNKNIRLIIYLGMGMSYLSCVEIYNPVLNLNDSVSLLVVEAKLTDEPGSFYVKLSRSVPIDIMASLIPELSAEVQLSDDKGNIYHLAGDNSGVYKTIRNNIKGEVGNTYILNIKTNDGLEYESEPVLMLDVPEIDKVHFDESTITIFGDQEPYEDYKVSILVDSKSFGDKPGYLKWEYEETWQFEMPTIVSVMHGTGEGDPPASIELVDVEPERKYCWASESTLSMLVNSTVSNANNRIEDFEIVSISYPDDKLNIRYSILVKQYALDRYLYSYFKKLRESNEEKGGLYDKTPSQIIGNIKCCNAEFNALGYFFASTEKKQRIYIDRFEHHLPKGSGYLNCGWHTDIPMGQPVYLYGSSDDWDRIYSTNRYCTDCRLRGTNIKPDFWE